MAETKHVERPLSPHIQIYRPMLLPIVSILVRITGHGVFIASFLVAWWLLAAAMSDAHFAVANAVMTSWFGDLVMTLALLGMWYHYFAGLRHLTFDAGRGLDVKTAETLGIVALVGSVVMTVITLLILMIV